MPAPRPPRTAPTLSAIVLTRNEAANIEDAVRSLLAQDARLEVLVVDGASTDGTVAIVERLVAEAPGRVRLVPARRLPIGPARNLGLEAAAAPIVAFMSADATAAPGWAAALLAALAEADIVYGRQVHDPPRLTVAAVVRGLRYHHFRADARAPPETYASNVNAGIRRDVFDRLRYVEGGPESALDDLLFTHEAREAGLRIAYARDAVVRHKDAATLGAEIAKNRREGYGWGILASRIGVNVLPLAWAAGLLAALASLALVPAAAGLALFGVVLWAPTLRRAARGGRPYLKRPHALLGALAVSPLLDLLFLLHYLRGLAARRGRAQRRAPPQGARIP